MVVAIPVIGALIIGFMARYGSKAIRGHGIPEAMEQMLMNESRIPARITFLKPVSSAISIGTGGPFGAEGPIIATGGALGSVFGQLIKTTSAERKTLLAAGAAAGMAATFGSPVSAVLLAVELLLFEYRPRSIIPVAFASATATAVRMAFQGMDPMFAMPNLEQPSAFGLSDIRSTGCRNGTDRGPRYSRRVCDRRRIRKTSHPLDVVACSRRGRGRRRRSVRANTLGVGYYNISAILSHSLALPALLFLCGMKFISWSIALGSGTSGGTLAPLFTIGGGIGSALGTMIAAAAPGLGVDPRIAALVGMASIFAGASRAMLASAVFAFETTLQPFGMLPLLGSCAAAYLVSSLLMRNSIMTEKISRRGVKTPDEYVADPLDQILVRNIATKQVVTLNSRQTIAQVQHWFATKAAKYSHQGYPVLDDGGILVGVLTRRDILTTRFAANFRNRRYRAPSAEVRLRRLHGSASGRSHGQPQHRSVASNLSQTAASAGRNRNAKRYSLRLSPQDTRIING